MPKLICKFCKDEFYSKHSVAKFCSKECGYSHQKGAPRRHLNKVMASTSAITKFNKIRRKGVLAKQLATYKDNLLDYPDSPNGKAYIGIAKKPLMQNKSGIGFQGVLLQDSTRAFVQCSSCGQWMQKITTNHVKGCSKGKIETLAQYKKKFGLLKSTGLVSDETSLNLTKAALKNKACREFGKKWAGNTKYTKRKHGDRAKRREWQNRSGTCPEQLKHRLKDFILRNRELPNANNRGRSLWKVFYRRFGGISGALKFYGLPSMERIGTTYIYKFPKGDIVKFNINKFDQREQLFEKMVMECDLFTKEDREMFLQTT